MSTNTSLPWFALQLAVNQEAKVKTYIEKFKSRSGFAEQIGDILLPTENVAEVKGGKKTLRTRKLYPGYAFIQVAIYQSDGKLNLDVWYFIKGVKGVLSFVGGDNPVALKPAEITQIKEQMVAAEGKVVPKVQFEVGEMITVTDGPFLNLQGKIEHIDVPRGRLKASVAIFGRFTPVELEFWQVKRYEEEKK